jgi:hypothetical protein
VGKSVSRARTETAANLAVARGRAYLRPMLVRSYGQRTSTPSMPFVIDDEGHFSGAARLKDLFTAPDQATLAS